MPNDNYNASVGQRVDLNPDLIILRVATDDPLFDFQAGQYTVLGLAASSPRVPFSDQEDPPEDERLIRRAYSISSSSRRKEYLEFYISLVRSGALTPRLFALQGETVCGWEAKQWAGLHLPASMVPTTSF